MPDITPAAQLIGLKPWVCIYRIDGLTYGITLYATNPEQIERDFFDFGEMGVVVEGELIGTFDA